METAGTVWDAPLTMAQPAMMGPPAGLLEAARRELEALEHKVTQRQLRLQDQSDQIVDVVLPALEAKIMDQASRMVDAVLPTIEAKVGTLEQQMSMLDWRLSEFGASIKGLHGELEMQVQQHAAAEARHQKWKKLIDDELRAKHADHKREITGLMAMLGQDPARPQLMGPGGAARGAGRGDGAELVTRVQLLDVANLLRDELRKMVAQATSSRASEEIASIAGMGCISATLRQEVEQMIECSTQSHASAVQREFANAADMLRRELHAGLDGARAASQREAFEFTDRLAREEQALGNLKYEVDQRLTFLPVPEEPGQNEELTQSVLALADFNKTIAAKVEQLAEQTTHCQLRLDETLAGAQHQRTAGAAAEDAAGSQVSAKVLEEFGDEIRRETAQMWCAIAEFVDMVGAQGTQAAAAAAKGGKAAAAAAGKHRPSIGGRVMEENVKELRQNFSDVSVRVDGCEQHLDELLGKVQGFSELLRQVATLAPSKKREAVATPAVASVGSLTPTRRKLDLGGPAGEDTGLVA